MPDNTWTLKSVDIPRKSTSYPRGTKPDQGSIPAKISAKSSSLFIRRMTSRVGGKGNRDRDRPLRSSGRPHDQEGARFVSASFDAGLVDGAVNGVASLLGRAGALLRRLQTGHVPAYVLSILVGVVILLGYLAFHG